MTFNAFLFQFLNGLSSASGLFFVAAGLSLIFGVTRIVNIAHGSLYMLGTYIAYSLATKIGGAFAQKNSATAASHMENGYYLVTLNATDTGTCGELFVAISASGALPVWRAFTVVPANVYESLVLGTEWLETTGLRADFSIAGTTLTVKKQDGTTTQYTQTLTTDAAAVPIVGAS